ncbi:MFS transporter [Streptacidiphilus sp. P02-A3a]|uniref:MFS transporter n=1 Tax=Streptacidiphilus sp. P02-A3a TaxID=2704468 RepID=UPI0015FE6CB9|nr:MFS transporter [Streptacidiphilus sp. P02-A3a]QMU71317.1 MFS transporter [Streptacidiphilus sp. P02-A3a]
MPPAPRSLTWVVPRYYALRGVGWLADQMLQFLLPVLAYRATGSLSWTGAMVATQWVPRLLSLPIAGLLADRFPERRIYAVNDVLRFGLGAAACGWAVAAPGQAYGVVIGFALLAGVACEQVLVAGEKMAGSLVPMAVMHRAQSVLSGLEQGALLLAPMLGGLLVLLGALPTVVVLTALFGASLLLTLSLPRGSGVRGEVPVAVAESSWRQLAGDLAAGVRNVVKLPVLRYVVLATMCVNVMLGVIQSAAPALVLGRYGHGEGALGGVYSVAGLVAMLTLTTVPRLIGRFGLIRIGVVSAVAQGIAFTVMGPTTGFVLFAAMTAVFMAGDSVFSVVIRTLRLRVVAAEEFGRTVAAISMLNFVSLPLAGLLLAVAGPVLPLAVLIPVVGAVVLAALALLLRRLARLPIAEPERESAREPEPAGTH